MIADDFPLYRYRATVRRIIDGDTIEVALDYGDHTYRTRRIRLLGYNATEMVGESRAAGYAARDALAKILPDGCRVYLATQLDRTNFDRLLAWGYADGDGSELLDISAAMIAAGHGAPA